MKGIFLGLLVSLLVLTFGARISFAGYIWTLGLVILAWVAIWFGWVAYCTQSWGGVWYRDAIFCAITVVLLVALFFNAHWVKTVVDGYSVANPLADLK